ncbi:uncharacterized protein [Phaseolus vulgaris]|uniref:uncharacterized protein isoform X1 n=1 Tax=Phaseolus vulgaris TaxID=3885 RepID=UPI0035CA925E
MVGTLVEIDKDTLEMDELEYARVLIKLPVAREARWSNCMKVNETLCQIAIEEEPFNNIKRCYFGEWERNYDDGDFGSFVGRECGASEGSEFGSNLNFHGCVGEEMTVEEAEGILRREARAATKDRKGDVDGQHITGIQNDRHINEVIDGLVGQDGCINEEGDDLEGMSRNFNVALNEVGGERQTLTELKNLYVDIGPMGDWAQFQTLERGMCLAGTGPSISEIEFSGIGSRADVALGQPNNGHLTTPVALVGDKGAFTVAACARRDTSVRMVDASAAVATRTEVAPAVHDAATPPFVSNHGRDDRREVVAVLSQPTRGVTRTGSLSAAHEVVLLLPCLDAPATPVGDGYWVVAETSSESGSDPAYSLVVRRPLHFAATFTGGLSVSPVGNVRFQRQATALPDVGQRLMEVGECSNSKSQKVGITCPNRPKDQSRTMDVRLVSSSTDFSNNGTKNCLVWLKNENVEADRIWKSGKELGYSRLGKNDDILNRLKELEERDNGKEGLDRGGLNGGYDETD